MPWSPEDSQGLSGALDSNALEETSCKLWLEFLKGYFDGAYHGLIAYPIAQIAFQQRAFTQEIEGVGIRIVGNVPGGTKPRRFGDGEWTLDNPASWTFLIVAKVTKPRTDGQNSDSLCRITSDLLYALTTKFERLTPLNRVGVQKIRAKPPVLAQSADYAARKMMVSATLHCIVREEFTSLMIGDSELIIGADGELLRMG